MKNARETAQTKRSVYLSRVSEPNFFLIGAQQVTVVSRNGRVTARFYGRVTRNDGGPVAGMNITTRSFVSRSAAEYEDGIRFYAA